MEPLRRSARTLSFHALQGSAQWWTAAILSTVLPLIYSYTGGMRASLVTDAVQVGPEHVSEHMRPRAVKFQGFR